MSTISTQHQLVQNGKVIAKSPRKLDIIYKHTKFRRSQHVTYRAIKRKEGV